MTESMTPRRLLARLTLLVGTWLVMSSAVHSVEADTGTGDAKPATTVGYGEISGAIDRTRSRYLARIVERARQQGIDTLIIRIDTDGGEVLYGREMLKLLLDQADDGPKTIALVDYRAISAGALVAYGHDEIFIADTASIGDIGVVFVGPGGKMEYAPEKIETIVRALLVQASETRGWSKGLLLKMTARNQQLYRVTLSDGTVDYVIEDDLPEFLARHPDIDREDPSQLIVYRGKDRLLTLTGREATELGMATALIDSLDGLYARLGIDPAGVVDLRPGAAERVAATVAPWAPILAGLALMFVLFELKTPGVGLWISLGGLCALLFLLSQYYLDMANNLEIVLIAAGLALVAVEMFTLLGGGLLSVIGGLSVLAGLIMAFLPNEFEFDPGDERFMQALGDASVSGLMAIGVMAAGLVAFIVLVPRSRLRHRLAVEPEISATSAGDLEAAAEDLVGRRGVTLDQLHPGGLVSIDGEQYTALSEQGTFIDAGEPVVVVAVRMGELAVRAEDGGKHPDSEAS